MVDPNTESDDIETTEAAEEEQPSNDLRATLEAAVKEQSDSEGEVATESETVAEARARDERGRFTQKQVSEPATQVEASEAREEPIAPPYSWSADQKEQFLALPREMQQYIIKREQDRESFIGRKSQEVSAVRERYAPVERIVDNYGDVFRKANLDPYQGLEQLVVAQQYLDKDPIGALQLMAQSYGIDLSQLANGAAQTVPQQQQVFPEMHYLTSELDTIRGKLAAIEQEKIAQQHRATVGEIEAFANERDNSGKLLRPYMGDVHEQLMDEVALLRQRNPEAPARQILQQAYETACWKNAAVRPKLIEQQRQPQIQAQRVQQARLAGSSVRGAPGASTLAAGSGSSIRDALMAAFEAHS